MQYQKPPTEPEFSVPRLSQKHTANPELAQQLAAQILKTPLDDMPHAVRTVRKKLQQMNQSELLATQRAVITQACDQIYIQVAAYYHSYYYNDDLSMAVEDYELEELSRPHVVLLLGSKMCSSTASI